MSSCLNTTKENIYDLAIVTNDGFTSYFYKAYMAINFDVYKTLFTGNFGDKNPDTISIDISRPELEIVAYYLLFGKFTLPDNPSKYKNAVNILFFADEKQNNNLKKECEAYIVANAKNIAETDTSSIDKIISRRHSIKEGTLIAIQEGVEKNLHKYRAYLPSSVGIADALYYVKTWEDTVTIMGDFINTATNTQNAIDETVNALKSWDLRNVERKSTCKLLHDIVSKCSDPNDYKLITRQLIDSLITCTKS